MAKIAAERSFKELPRATQRSPNHAPCRSLHAQ
jgi:hypothetical protein